MVSQVPYRSFKDQPLRVIVGPCAVLIACAIAVRGDWVTGLGPAFVIGGLAYATAFPVARVRARLKAQG
jgi:hypothetical protein